MITLQDAILRLQSYWASVGCLIWQPVNTEVGAGTMNPATFLRVLGTAPWNVAYVEPSVRPDDSRYGDNPNRIQTHTQFQVILKPDTGHPQEQYLKSLEELGIDLEANDIRFVEDNWESPALGAWGLGWEVWLNGLEITQFTYFQQAGGHVLERPSVELTYGLERILMALQRVQHFKDIRFNSEYSYGELLGRSEYEWSVYYLDAADTDGVRARFSSYASEAEALIERGLAPPAYQYLLKMSHAFNILDARGGVGVTERAKLFGQMRYLARRCADLWLAGAEGEEAQPASPPAAPAAAATAAAEPPSRATLLLEVGTEELPHTHLRQALDQLRQAAPALLDSLGLPFETVEVDGTPRRLTMIVRGVEGRQADSSRTVKGPRADVAWSPDGSPTAAADGFARRNGLDASELVRESVDGVEFAVARVHTSGLPATEVLASGLGELILGIRFPRSMRWNSSGVSFGRPIRWVVALLGETPIAVQVAGVSSGRTTQGIRRGAGSDALLLASADDYASRVADAHVMLSTEERRARIWDGAQALAARAGGSLESGVRATLVPEIADLVEEPHCIEGAFDEAYLDLPPEVLSTVMVKHQRYLPVHGQDGLRPTFVAVANGPVDADAVRAGNEAVLRARFADARFFYAQDRQRPLEAFRQDLSLLLFHERLGSMADKADRLERLTGWLVEAMDVEADDAAAARRAAGLAKNDLATSLVVEFTSLAGVMGSYYAAADGEPEAVSRAIRDHVLPAYAGDALPGTRAGAVVGIADRLDTLVGLMSAGVQVRGSSDPYALRRSAIGLVQVMVAHALEVDLEEALRAAGDGLPDPPGDDEIGSVLEFVLRRFEQWQTEAGRPLGLVRAVLAGRSTRSPSTAHRRIEELEGLIGSARLLDVERIVNRANRISRTADAGGEIDESLFEAEAEHRLWRAYAQAKEAVRASASVAELLEALEDLVDPVDRFFDDVLVQSPDPRIAANRLELLRRVADLPSGWLDLSQLAELGGAAQPVPGAARAT